MRTFADPTGLSWQVVVGKESWGNLVALFVPVQRSDPVRQSVLRATTYADAVNEIEAMDEKALIQLLAMSRIKEG